MQAAGARALLAADPGAAGAALEVIGETSRRAVDEVRALVDVLRADDEAADPGAAPVFADPGAVAPPGLEDVAGLLSRARRAGLPVSLSLLQTADVAPEVPEHEVLLTEAAAAKVAGLLVQEGRDDLRLRVAVQPGGCSGLVYQLYFDERLLDGDAVRAFPTGDGELAEVEVVVDRMSVPYLSGATIDFADTIEKQGFTIDNPNAAGSCACGESFH